jgi:hypothetical protein
MPDEKVGGISGVGIAAILAGGILAWSSVKGWKLSLVTQDFLSGKNPQNDPRIPPSALTVTAAGLLSPIASAFNPVHLLSASGGSSSGSTTATVVGGSSGRFGSAFAKSVLASIGAPQTSANIASIEAWARREGGGGANNPLNTTFSMPGASDFNSVGVKNYTSMAQGILATAKTLLGGGYSDVIAALRSGNGLCGQSFSGLSTWSGGGYSSVC